MINKIFTNKLLQSFFLNLKKAYNIIILSHKSPDGDAVGSTLALQEYLLQKGIISTIILPDAIPSFLNWLSKSNEIIIFENEKEKATNLLENADAILTLDFNDQTRVGKEMSNFLIKSNAFKIMIDHHQEPKNYAQITFSDTNACSTAQLIYELIEANKDLSLINKSIAKSIYTGIVTDTGSFRFSSTTAKTHQIASYLLKTGIKQNQIHELIYDVNTTSRLQLLGYTLNQKLEILKESRVAIISLTSQEMKKFNTQKGYTEGFVNYALSIIGIKVGIFVKEDTDLVKISFRSKGEIPVNEFSKLYFEGGGHINAAGGRSFLTIQETIDKIKKNIVPFMNKYITNN